MKKGDVIIFITILLAGLSLWMLGKFCLEKSSTYSVRINGTEVLSGSLYEEKVINLESYGAENVIEIKNGSISVIESTCKNHVCVKTGAINGGGQIICCLPHNLVITVSGKGDIDAESY